MSPFERLLRAGVCWREAVRDLDREAVHSKEYWMARMGLLAEIDRLAPADLPIEEAVKRACEAACRERVGESG